MSAAKMRFAIAILSALTLTGCLTARDPKTGQYELTDTGTVVMWVAVVVGVAATIWSFKLLADRD